MKQGISVLVILAAATAAGAAPELALELAVEPGAVAFEGPLTFTTRLVNRGDEPVRYFEPEFVDLNCFPAIRIERIEDGRMFLPYNPPFQSMWSEGLAGAIITLGPGESREHTYARARFLSEGGRRTWQKPVPLPGGTYVVTAVYERPDGRLPVRLSNFRSKTEVHDGIFTGKVESAPRTLLVGSPTRPRVTLAAPDESKAELLLTFENPTESEHVFRGVARLVVGSKMYGGGEALPHLPSGRDAKPGEITEIRVPARDRKEVRLDLRRLTYVRTRRDSAGETMSLGELNPQGVMSMAFSLEPEKGEGWSTDGTYVMVPPVADRGMEGLVATAIVIPSEVSAGESVKVTLNLRNRGSAARRVVRRLAFPQEFVVRVEDADGKRRSVGSVTRTAGSVLTEEFRGGMDSKVADPLSWDGDAFDPAPGLEQSDFTELPPDGEIRKTIDLQARLAKGLTPGRYVIRVGYRSVDPGRRFGWEGDARAPTGVVWSGPVILTVK